MPTIDLGRVKGDTGVSMRSKGSWTPSTAYVNNSQYIDVVTNGGNSYACKTSHTSGSTFSSDNWNLVAQKGAKGDKGDKGNTPTIQAGTVTSLASTAAPTVTATTSGETTTFNFGIPKGDTSKIETPTFTDTVSTYTTLAAANTAAETASNAIKSKVSIFTTLSNTKKSFSAIVQGLKILATNVGAIRGITSDINSESTAIAASSKMVHDLNSNLSFKWVALTLKYGSTQAWNQLIIRKFGNICILVGVLVVPAGAVAWEKRQIFTFPAEFIPTGIINTMGVTNNNKIYRLMTDGTKADIVFQENITSEQEIWFNVPYISG